MQFTRKIVLSLLIIVLCSVMAFASDESPVPEQAPLEVEDAPFTWVDLEQVAIMKTAQDIKAATATDYTTTDIYNLLYAALRGRSSSSTYSLVAMNSDIRNMYQDLSGFFSPSIGFSPLQSLQYLPSIASVLGVTSPNQTSFVNSILDSLYLSAGGNNYSQAELTGMIWSLVQDISSDTNSLYSISSTLSSVKSSVDSIINTFPISCGSFLGVYDSSYSLIAPPSGYLNTGSTSLNVAFSLDHDNSKVYCVYLPIRRATNDPTTYTFSFKFADSSFSSFYDVSMIYNYEVTKYGIYVYFIPERLPLGSYNILFNVSCPNTLYYYGYIQPYFNGVSSYDVNYYHIYNNLLLKGSLVHLDNIDSDTDHLSSIAGYTRLMRQDVKSLADYFVSPAKQAAENASNEVIQETLDDFTGSGTGAAKKADSKAMKDVSGSLQSGLNGGGSVSGATGVFNSGSDFWGWFTQQNSNYINNPYPAPTVNSTRGSGDEIVDFLTPNSNQLQDLLRQGGEQR